MLTQQLAFILRNTEPPLNLQFMATKPAKFDGDFRPALGSVSRRYTVTAAGEARTANFAPSASTFAHEFLKPLVQLRSIGMPLGRPSLKML
jgi:hypothetical protein